MRASSTLRCLAQRNSDNNKGEMNKERESERDQTSSSFTIKATTSSNISGDSSFRRPIIMSSATIIVTDSQQLQTTTTTTTKDRHPFSSAIFQTCTQEWMNVDRFQIGFSYFNTAVWLKVLNLLKLWIYETHFEFIDVNHSHCVARWRCA